MSTSEDESQSVRSRPLRRWFRFSLKTLLIVITVCCLWFGYEVNRATKLRRARKATSTTNRMYGTTNRFPAPKWLRDLIGEEYFIDFTYLRLTFHSREIARGSPEEDVLVHLDTMPRLEELSIEGDHFTDKGMHLIPPLRDLWSLEIWHCHLSADGIGELRKFKKLRRLWLDSKHFTDDDLQPVASLHTVEDLTLNDTRISDTGLEIVTQLPNLKELSLERTPVTDAGLKHLMGLKQLKWLDLLGCPEITADGIDKLKLALPNCKIRHPFERPKKKTVDDSGD